MKATYTIGGDLTVHRMGYGAMRITGDGIWGPPKDRKEAIKVLKRAVELGVDFIDTADSYGPHVSEELIAEALHPYPKGLVIATKGGLLRTGPNQWPVDCSPKHLEEALHGSLKRLKVDRIDLYQLHRVDPKVPFEESLAFLKKAQEKGLIRHIGLSEVSVDEIKTARRHVNIASVQNKYSIDYRHWEPVLDYTEKEGIAFIPWYPLGGGHVEKTLGAFGNPHQVALAWLLGHKQNILLIPGTSSVKHLEENMEAAKLTFNKEQLAQLQADFG